ncbi:LacI family DNA-binding transcriptional regulator [Paenibacillus sp. NFR01]|uniref:LacI family DNA-binding transcriptional regulator n=1 Tax=Paenibacillus sp. NFR01 TaxID=1566279 RepID=UPI0008AEE470|nr:LacI family DNA-binding transcriptional regulator [Paenibacillus sp. NFR01]SET22685.1 transcriptional regulator, LacI family [Paenibacillus sp. NFR01]
MNMEELAKRAGVSKGAVSLALNGKPGVGPDTRERILQLADELGYTVRSRASEAKSKGKSLRFLVFTNAGLVHNDYYQQPFFRELIHHIEERCRARGYSLIFSAIEESQYGQGVQNLIEDRASGVILLGTNLDARKIAELAAKLPQLIVLDTCYEAIPVHFVEINNYMGAYQAGSYLAGLGHRNIGYVSSDEPLHNFAERRRGFFAALEEHRLGVAKGNMLAVPPTLFSSQEPLRQQLKQLKNSGQPFPTAFFCECDYMAISAMKALTELGFAIPGDVSVVGFDNIQESLIMTPELTTVHVEKEQLAHLAVDLLIRAIHEETTVHTKVKVDTRFVERGSCRKI